MYRYAYILCIMYILLYDFVVSFILYAINLIMCHCNLQFVKLSDIGYCVGNTLYRYLSYLFIVYCCK